MLPCNMSHFSKKQDSRLYICIPSYLPAHQKFKNLCFFLQPQWCACHMFVYDAVNINKIIIISLTKPTSISNYQTKTIPRMACQSMVNILSHCRQLQAQGMAENANTCSISLVQSLIFPYSSYCLAPYLQSYSSQYVGNSFLGQCK